MTRISQMTAALLTRWTVMAAVVFVAAGCGVANFRMVTDESQSGSQSEPQPEPQAGPRPVLGSEVFSPVGPTVDISSFLIEAGQDGFAQPGDAEIGIPSPVSPDTVVAHVLFRNVVAYAEPRDDAPVVAAFTNPTTRGGPLVFRAASRPVDGWIEVLLPIRPNGTKGWVRVHEVELTYNPYRIKLDVAAHQLTIFREEEVVLQTMVAIGNGETPTPIGDFYLIELLRSPDPSGVYGPYAFGLSGFSESLTSFNGGQGVIGIHGTNQPALLGTDVSHGCIRVDNNVITDMAGYLPLGTPVSIR